MNKAQNLGLFELLNGAEFMNNEVGLYLSLTPEDVRAAAKKYLTRKNSASLIYLPL